MNHLHRFLNFTTVEEGEKNLKEAIKLQQSMCGWLYSSILADDCCEIAEKLAELKLAELKRKNNELA